MKLHPIELQGRANLSPTAWQRHDDIECKMIDEGEGRGALENGHLLAFVHDLLLRSHLHRCQRFHVGAVIAEAGGDLLVEGVDEVLEAAAERAEGSFLENVGAALVARRRLVRVAVFGETRVQARVQQLLCEGSEAIRFGRLE